MKLYLYTLLIGLLGFALPGFGQTPVITVPINGAINVAYVAGPAITVTSNSTGNDPSDPETINVEISNASDFAGSYYWGSDDILKEDNLADSYNLTGPTDLTPSTLYYIRGTSDKNGNGTTNTFTTAAAAVTGGNRLSLVNAVAANTTAAALTVFPNSRWITLTLNQNVANATQNVIQFDTTSAAFTHIIDSIVFTGTSVRMKVDVGGIAHAIMSGTPVFVRSHGRNTTSYGPFSGGGRKYGAPLQPAKLVTPTGTIDRYSFKLWTNAVGKATKYYFQVDDDPTFASPHSLTGSFSSLNKTVTGITGNVFENNYSVGGTGRAFNYLTQTTNTTYYVRVRAWNTQQNGYWADTLTIAPLPALTTKFNAPTALQTNVSVAFGFLFYDDPNYAETKWDFQLSRSATFATIDNNQPGITRRYSYVPNMLYNTTYYARVRSYVGASVSPWATVQFTTQATPNIYITAPASGQIWPNTGVWCYSNWEGSVTQYQWQVEKLNAPTSSTSGTSTFYGRNFASYIQRGGSYRVRVLGYSATQSLTGSYSAWVNFSVSPPPPGPRAEGPDHADANGRIGEEIIEPATYPNPFGNQVTLSLPPTATLYTVTDMQGRLVERNTQPQLSQEVGQNWPTGIYLITVATPDGAKRLRVVKQ